MMRVVLPYTAAQFARGIIMPNLVPPVTTVAARFGLSRAYPGGPAGRDELLADDDLLPHRRDEPGRDRAGLRREGLDCRQALPGWGDDELARGCDGPRQHRPRAGADGSGSACRSSSTARWTDQSVDIFDREAVFMEQKLLPLLARHQGLKVTVEHATPPRSSTWCAPMRAGCPRRSRRITSSQPHAHFPGRIAAAPVLPCRSPSASGTASPCARPRPPARIASTSGPTPPRTRSAPRNRPAAAPGSSAGRRPCRPTCRSSNEEGALDRFEAFASLNGARFHGLAPNEGTITLERRGGQVSPCVEVDDTAVVVFRGDETLPWTISGH